MTTSIPHSISVSLGLTALAFFAHLSSAYAVTLAGPGHMDIDMNVNSSGQWTFALSHDGAGSGFEGGNGSGAFHRPANTDTVIYIPGGESLNRPSPTTWNFLGAPAGAQVWIFPQNQDDDYVWPGLNTEATSLANVDTWQPSHPLLTTPAQYMELRITGMQYFGSGATNHFSLWTNGSFGTPNVWMSTADGISTADAFFMLPGGHSHMNWGFSSEGIYDLTFQARTMQNGSLITSDPFTLRFGVGTAEIVPEPARAILALIGVSALFISRRRRFRSPSVASY